MNKGFEADHKDIALLRLRDFTMGKKIADEDVLSEGGIQRIADTISALVPWVRSPYHVDISVSVWSNMRLT